MQSESVAQLVKQAPGPHTYGVHCVLAAEGQVPVPLQEPAGTAVPAAQLAARHWVEAPGYPQAVALLPSQVPPQAEPSVQQTPSVQMPPVHSPAPLQAVP